MPEPIDGEVPEQEENTEAIPRRRYVQRAPGRVAGTPASRTAVVSRYAAGVAAIAGILVIAGSVLPWATATGLVSVSVDGTSGDGKITLVLGLVVLLGALPLALAPLEGYWDMALEALGLLLCLAAFFIAAYDGANISQKIGDVTAQTSLFMASVGSGIYLVAVGGAAGAGMLFIALVVAGRQPR